MEVIARKKSKVIKLVWTLSLLIGINAVQKNVQAADLNQTEKTISCKDLRIQGAGRPIYEYELRLQPGSVYQLRIVDNTNFGHPILFDLTGRFESAATDSAEIIFSLHPSGSLVRSEHSGPPWTIADTKERVLKIKASGRVEYQESDSKNVVVVKCS